MLLKKKQEQGIKIEAKSKKKPKESTVGEDISKWLKR